MSKIANPTGKGGFGERPQDINREGAPKRGQTWSESIKRITDMDREELIKYVGGGKTRIGRLLAKMPADIPIKDGMIVAAIVSFMMDPDARMFEKLTDREEGKPPQSVSLSNPDGSNLFDPSTMKPSEIAKRSAALQKATKKNAD